MMETDSSAVPVPAQYATPDAWPERRVVARMPGSLPMGGIVAQTPIHAFASTPRTLALRAQPECEPARRDIDLHGQLAFVIDDVATAQEVASIVEASEHFGFREEAPGIATPPGMRMNKSVHWVADDALLGPLMARIAPLLPGQVGGARLHGRLSHRLNIYRYDQNDVFNRHLDGDWPGYGLNEARTAMLEWGGGLRSCLTMLLYLNDADDGVSGGNTRLLGRDRRWTDVTPKKGSALFFRHGLTPDSVIHIGCRVESVVPKYVARINVMYEFP